MNAFDGNEFHFILSLALHKTDAYAHTRHIPRRQSRMGLARTVAHVWYTIRFSYEIYRSLNFSMNVHCSSFVISLMIIVHTICIKQKSIKRLHIVAHSTSQFAAHHMSVLCVYMCISNDIHLQCAIMLIVSILSCKYSARRFTHLYLVLEN